jgi:hypothetical protein
MGKRLLEGVGEDLLEARTGGSLDTIKPEDSIVVAEVQPGLLG